MEGTVRRAAWKALTQQVMPAFFARAPSGNQPGRPWQVTGQPAGPRHHDYCSARQRIRLWGRTTNWMSPQRTVLSGGICGTFTRTELRRRIRVPGVDGGGRWRWRGVLAGAAGWRSLWRAHRGGGHTRLHPRYPARSSTPRRQRPPVLGFALAF